MKKVLLVILYFCLVGCAVKHSSSPTCNENLVFKETFFKHVKNVENLLTIDQNESFHESLHFISKYSHVSYEDMLNYARTYPISTFEKDKKIWLQWYEENKCNNIQSKNHQNNFVGIWSIRAHIYGDSQTSYNVPPKIHFNNDGSGKIVFASKSVCNFKYQADLEKISFSFDSQKDKDLFITKGDFIFNYVIVKEEDGETCELQIDSQEKFILGRGK